MAKARILAVDDQRYFRELIEGLLTGEGYAVRTAASGEEALHVLEREDFDVVVTDLVMPGLDGGQLVEAIKQRDADQDVVMVTGVVDVKTAVDAMKQGATDYILKPFDRNTLIRSLDAIVQRRRLKDEHARLVAENLEYMEVLSLTERALALFSTLSLEPLGERLVDALCLETRAQGGVLWLADGPGERRLGLAAVRGLIRVEEEPEELRSDRLGPELAPLAESGRALVRPSRAVGGVPSIFVPLRQGGALLGVARLSDKLEGAGFDERDLAAADKFADLVAPAVANALRFRELERRSFRDPTTKAYTHAYFEDVIRNEIRKADRFGRHFSLLRADLGALGELRRSAGEGAVSRWLESLVHEAHQALRSTDLLAVEGEGRFAVLLPETDALGAAVLKERIARAVEESGVLDGTRPEMRRELTLAAATFPTDGTQLEGLERALDARIEEVRGSTLRELALREKSFAEAAEALLERAESAPAALAGEAARLLLREAGRRPEDRGLLVVAPGGLLAEPARQELERLAGAGLGPSPGGPGGMEIVWVSDAEGEPATALPVSRVRAARLGWERPFLLFFGEGPAYALLTDAKASASRDGAAERRIYHTADRALVEHLVFQLHRDLGAPIGA